MKKKKSSFGFGTAATFVLFLAVFAFSAVKVVSYVSERHKAESSYDSLRGFTARPAETTVLAATSAATETPEPEHGMDTTEAVYSSQPAAVVSAAITADPEENSVDSVQVTLTPVPAAVPVLATATPEPTAVPAPVSTTSVPTAAPVPATATPEPAVTAVPSETPAVTGVSLYIEETPSPAPVPEPSESPEPSVRPPKVKHVVPAPARKPAVTPEPSKAPRIAMDFGELHKRSSNIVAWIEGTAIDYPVVQGRDNTFYLTHLWNGEKNSSGSIFMDSDNSGRCDDKNIVLYGHFMRDGSMFAALDNYKRQSYYESHPTMTLYTPAGDYIVELFAGTIEDGNYAFVRFGFSSDKAFLNYVDSLKSRSQFKSSVEILPGDRLITLCTCSYEQDNARFMVTGKLTPIYD